MNRVKRATASMGACVLVASALAACSSDSSSDPGPQAAATGESASHVSPAAAAGESDSPAAEAPGTGASRDAISAIDLCQWVDWETAHDRVEMIQGPPDNTAALPVMPSEGFLLAEIGPDSTKLTCRIPAAGVGVGVVHQETTAFTATLVADPAFAFVADDNPPRPFTSQSLAHATHPVAISTADGTVAIELEDGVYLVLAIDSIDERMNDANVPSLVGIAGRMTDAWDAGRVPTFPSPPEYAADVVGLCAAAAGDADLTSALGVSGPLALTATGEVDVTDGVRTPRVSCTYTALGAEPTDTASLDIDLSWAPSLEDASLAGGESQEGCITSDGLLLSCQPGWIYYVTVTGRWAVQTELRDPAHEADLVTHGEIADEARQRAVVNLGDAITANASRITLADDVDRGQDPRAVRAEVMPEAPAGAECSIGFPVSGVETARVSAIVCDAQDGAGELVGTLDGSPFAGPTFSQYPACGFVQVADRPLPPIVCVSDGTVEMLVEGDDAEYLGREYVDSAWYLAVLGP